MREDGEERPGEEADSGEDAPAEEHNEGWEGPAEDIEEDPAYNPDDEDLEGIKGA